jgi:hypothetical protein
MQGQTEAFSENLLSAFIHLALPTIRGACTLVVGQHSEVMFDGPETGSTEEDIHPEP